MTEKKNQNLQNARKAKDDCFYTQIGDIENELKHYKTHFENKIIFCNCDDPEYSNFWKYFYLNFNHLKLKKLISTHFKTDSPTYKMEYTGIGEPVVTPLSQNGDFRSPECIELLKESDIICTNPPFSLFREYIAQLMKYHKKFLIIGNQNAATYKEVFPLIQTNEIWMGCNYGDMAFKVPSDSEPRETRFWIDDSGQKWRSMGNICWFTNLDVPKRHENMILFKHYCPNDYDSFINCSGINVDKISEIPSDYDGVMGVPLTFISNYNPNQFEILGISSNFKKVSSEVKAGAAYIIRNDKIKRLYTRIIIKKKTCTSPQIIWFPDILLEKYNVLCYTVDFLNSFASEEQKKKALLSFLQQDIEENIIAWNPNNRKYIQFVSNTPQYQDIFLEYGWQTAQDFDGYIKIRTFEKET